MPPRRTHTTRQQRSQQQCMQPCSQPELAQVRRSTFVHEQHTCCGHAELLLWARVAVACVTTP